MSITLRECQKVNKLLCYSIDFDIEENRKKERNAILIAHTKANQKEEKKNRIISSNS